MTTESKTNDNDSNSNELLWNEKEEEKLIELLMAAALGSKYANLTWKTASTKDKNLEIKYAYLTSDSNTADSLATVKATTYTDIATPEEYYEFLEAAEGRNDVMKFEQKLDPMAKTLRIEKFLNKDRLIVYGNYDSGFQPFISPRDLCYMKRRVLLKNYKIDDKIYESISFDLCYSLPETYKYYTPLNKSSVRGDLKYAGVIFSRLKGSKKTQLSYLVQLDPKGWLPTWIVNLAAPDQGMVCQRLRENIKLMKLMLSQRKQLTLKEDNNNTNKNNDNNTDNNKNEE